MQTDLGNGVREFADRGRTLVETLLQPEDGVFERSKLFLDLLGSGEEVSLEFNSSILPALRPGWSRDYFLYADGFAKDMDFYSAYSSTVEPLPFHGMGPYTYGMTQSYPSDPAHLEYRLQWNSRYASDRSRMSYRLNFP